MKKLLILNQNSPVVAELSPQLQEIDGLKVVQFQGNLQSAGDYAAALTGVDWLLAALGPLDVDLDFEALFDAIEETAPKIQHFIMLSYAGIDDELTGPTNYPEVPNRPEFIKQQRYAVKLVDESEIPYSIIRMSALTDQGRSTYRLFNEGAVMPVGQVAAKNVADLVLTAFVNQERLNQSVGIVDVNDNH
ncbi:NAD(P)-binding oxidoreductase [Lentilactobacillus raoultii]|uniref:NAD(P)-binding oxidoreductase n=1 Tax=Lentilactobacillus raoultii TaxID=1987503 RepID=A0ABW3PM86_9LACO|nr:NAD(P)-binding oxidoreductase [Lentilactobacillus raoultii]